MEQIDRIRENEARLDRVSAACALLAKALETYAAAQPDARALAAYYGSEEWKRDFADEEKGLLPDGLKRGVLSEDEAYDVLSENRALLAELLEVCAKVLKGV